MSARGLAALLASAIVAAALAWLGAADAQVRPRPPLVTSFTPCLERTLSKQTFGDLKLRRGRCRRGEVRLRWPTGIRGPIGPPGPAGPQGPGGPAG